MSNPRILLYLLRRDLRFADNPVFHEVSTLCQQSDPHFTHLLPVYVFSAQQLEVSGFLSSDSEKSPYPEARSQVGGFWRCGPHRAKFLAESLWDVKKSLEVVGSGLTIRVGMIGEIVKDMLNAFQQDKSRGEIVTVWMTSEEGVEEKREEREVRRAVEEAGKQFKLWVDEKYYVDDRDVPYKPHALPDIFTSYRKSVEPLREQPRPVLAAPAKLPSLPPTIPSQPGPFTIPDSLPQIISCLRKPLDPGLGLPNPPQWPKNARSAHPFVGGETSGHQRIKHLITSGSMTAYKETRNGMLGLDFSTKLSAWLALGCVTARQVHEYLVNFEEAKTDLGKGTAGYGKGSNEGTDAVRFELLWRDYMRLCTRKFGPRLFRIEGFRNDTSYPWKYPQKDKETERKVTRFLQGTTGTGLIDASMRELFLTGYTSNRARQNVASFLAKHLAIDWRIGAEWYESLLCDYDLSSNWGNWQYTAGVGNDPRGEARIFNPVKQAFDYDSEGRYVKTWVEELQPMDDPQIIFQAWKLPLDKRKEAGLMNVDWIEDPLKRIEFHIGKPSGRSNRGNTGRGGRGNSTANGHGRGGTNGFANGKGGIGGRGGGYNGRGKGDKYRGQGRMGKMDKADQVIATPT